MIKNSEVEMNNNYTLYYPTIEFNNPCWLWSAALLWDRIYRIVPENYELKDSENIKKLIYYDEDLINNINPKIYTQEASKNFINSLNHKDNKWWAAALDSSNYKKKEYIELHKDKADVKLREMILGKNKIKGNWMNMPTDMASIYMLYLATEIAERNNINLSTDYAEAWCGSNFFQYDGNLNDSEYMYEKTVLSAITIESFIPSNIMNLSAKELIDFRNKSNQERKRYFFNIEGLYKRISLCEDEKIINDLIHDNIKELEESKKEYKKRMRDIKAESFLGVKTLMVPIVTTVANSIGKMPDEISNGLNLTGVGIGIIGGFWEEHKKNSKERKNYECNYLMQLEKHIPRSYNLESNNIHSGYHQFLNDNLNHFLRD